MPSEVLQRELWSRHFGWKLRLVIDGGVLQRSRCRSCSALSMSGLGLTLVAPACRRRALG
jgi:hypothetical protein